MIAENNSANNMNKSWPRWCNNGFLAATALFFFWLPLQTRFIFREMPLYEWGTISLYIIEVLGWVVIGLGSIKIKNEKLKMKNGWLLILPFLAFASILWAADKAVALQAAVRLLEGVLLYVVVAQTFRSESGRSKDLRYMLWWSFIMGATAQAILGIYQFLSQSSFASTLLGMALHDPRALGTSVVEFGDQRWLRAYGGLPNPNVLGGYLAVALAIGILWFINYQRFEQSNKNTRGRGYFCQVFLKVITPILLTGIFFSFSRATWIVTLVLLVVLWCGKKQTVVRFLPQRIFMVLMIFYVGVLAIVFRPLVATRLHSDSRLEVKSRVERISGLRESWEVIKKHPILGTGIGNYTQTVARELRPGEPLYSYQPVHSVPLLVWVELGIVGLLLLAGALYKIVRQSKFYILHFTFLILLLFDHYLWTLPLGILLFWAVLGLSTHKPQTNT